MTEAKNRELPGFSREIWKYAGRLVFAQVMESAFRKAFQ